VSEEGVMLSVEIYVLSAINELAEYRKMMTAPFTVVLRERKVILKDNAERSGRKRKNHANARL
jgi:hypothetical protein